MHLKRAGGQQMKWGKARVGALPDDPLIAMLRQHPVQMSIRKEGGHLRIVCAIHYVKLASEAPENCYLTVISFISSLLIDERKKVSSRLVFRTLGMCSCCWTLLVAAVGSLLQVLTLDMKCCKFGPVLPEDNVEAFGFPFVHLTTTCHFSRLFLRLVQLLCCRYHTWLWRYFGLNSSCEYKGSTEGGVCTHPWCDPRCRWRRGRSMRRVCLNHRVIDKSDRLYVSLIMAKL